MLIRLHWYGCANFCFLLYVFHEIFFDRNIDTNYTRLYIGCVCISTNRNAKKKCFFSSLSRTRLTTIGQELNRNAIELVSMEAHSAFCVSKAMNLNNWNDVELYFCFYSSHFTFILFAFRVFHSKISSVVFIFLVVWFFVQINCRIA